jgi:hypothetical protein
MDSNERRLARERPRHNAVFLLRLVDFGPLLALPDCTLLAMCKRNNVEIDWLPARPLAINVS